MTREWAGSDGPERDPSPPSTLTELQGRTLVVWTVAGWGSMAEGGQIEVDFAPEAGAMVDSVLLHTSEQQSYTVWSSSRPVTIDHGDRFRFTIMVRTE